MAKMKLWLAKEYLNWREAVDLFSAITETEASPADFADLARKYKTPVYTTSYPSCSPTEETYHQDSPTFLAYGGYRDGEAAVYCDFGNGGANYIDGNGIIHSSIALFKPADIEDLAAKINGKPPAQEELEQLRKRVTELEAENKALKESGHVPGGLVFPYSTPELAVMQEAAKKHWKDYNPETDRMPLQKEIGAEITEAFGWKPGDDGVSREAKTLARAILPKRYRQP